MPKKETKTLILILLLADILSISLFSLLYSFTKNKIIKSIDIENNIKTELKKDDIRILMKDDLILGKMYQEKLMEYVLPSGSTVDFIKILEELITNSNLKSDVKTFSNESYDKGNSIGLELLKINMDVIGEWKNVQFFIKSLENYPLKIDIKKTSLNKFSDYVVNGKKIPQWSGNFEFTVVKVKDIK